MYQIFLGKQLDELKSSAAQSAAVDHCFSLVSGSGALNLEAESMQQRDAWLFGITALSKAHTAKIDLLLAESAARGIEISVACRS